MKNLHTDFSDEGYRITKNKDWKPSSPVLEGKRHARQGACQQAKDKLLAELLQSQKRLDAYSDQENYPWESTNGTD